MRVEIAIVADDLSGAADCAAGAAVHGLETDVVIDPAGAEAVEADVVAIDANTRQLGPHEAAAVTRRCVLAVGRAPWLYKKIDSTLRGNVGSEIAAALAARRTIDHRAVVVMAPAFPATGRTTVGGRQYVNGVPLERTEHWSRERAVADADVARLLVQAGLETRVVDLAGVRSGPALASLLQARAGTCDAVVCDAETEADLGAIADAAVRLDRATVWAGSAGLAAHLPRAAGLPGRQRVRPLAARGPILFVVGSPASASRAQADALAREPGVVRVPADRVDEVLAALARGEEVVSEPTSVEAAAGLAPAARLASGLVLTGGETARAVLRAMGIGRLRLVDEIDRGVPRAMAFRPEPLPVVTKAGAFGGADTLTRVRAALRNLQQA